MAFRVPGHSVIVEENTDILMFRPQKEHGDVIEHVLKKLDG